MGGHGDDRFPRDLGCGDDLRNRVPKPDFGLDARIQLLCDPSKVGKGFVFCCDRCIRRKHLEQAQSGAGVFGYLRSNRQRLLRQFRSVQWDDDGIDHDCAPLVPARRCQIPSTLHVTAGGRRAPSADAPPTHAWSRH
jgi:hypothetical protein